MNRENTTSQARRKPTTAKKKVDATKTRPRTTRGKRSPPKSAVEPRALLSDAQKRVWIERVQPEIDHGRWPAKAILGDRFRVEVDLVADGHDVVAGALRYRLAGTTAWKQVALTPVVNDRFTAEFECTKLGVWEYTIEAWEDEFATWQALLRKRVDAHQDLQLELLTGAEIVNQAADRATGKDRERLATLAKSMASPRKDVDARVETTLGTRLSELMASHPNRELATRYARILELRVDRPKARCSAWYELFPRSTGAPGAHGTFRDVESILPYVASMGFDVLYLPPIHPIGVSHRKGKNNSLTAGDDEPGSPWAIGNKTGGHKSIHPELGTVDDFRRLVSKANEHGLEIALDIALQASPDHPYVTEHPEWFKHRADGTIQYAENPPKKYQDIYPLHFGSKDWQSMWREMHSIFQYWIDQGVRIFRVDNPHTKPLEFWAWCLRDLTEKHPDVIFLAEAFTRPKLMYALAKAGFSQSYTYFTWRNSAAEMREYLRELTASPIRDFFRPNFWPNTPDILPEHLQFGGRAAFIARLVLAATLSSNYGIYGPAYELMEHDARPGSEEYIDNEKYEVRQWNLDDPDSLRPVITRINRSRRDHPALQDNDRLRFHRTDNDQLLCYSKHTGDGQDRILVVVNMDHYNTQSGWVDLDLGGWDMDWHETYQVHDLLSDARYTWHGARNYVELNPYLLPAHVFAIRRFVRRENDFDYYA